MNFYLYLQQIAANLSRRNLIPYCPLRLYGISPYIEQVIQPFNSWYTVPKISAFILSETSSR
jgi:hypothetical protein